jgi:hypothetical protein
MFPQILKSFTNLFQHFYYFLLFLLHRLLFFLIAVLKYVSQVTAFTILGNDIKESIVLFYKLSTWKAS